MGHPYDKTQELPSDRILPEYSYVMGQEMEEAVHQALGAASVSWNPMDCTGTFDEKRARQIAQELMGIVVQFAQDYPRKPEGALVVSGTPPIFDVKTLLFEQAEFIRRQSHFLIGGRSEPDPVRYQAELTGYCHALERYCGALDRVLHQLGFI
jgi:hypothetical protein